MTFYSTVTPTDTELHVWEAEGHMSDSAEGISIGNVQGKGACANHTPTPSPLSMLLKIYLNHLLVTAILHFRETKWIYWKTYPISEENISNTGKKFRSNALVW